MSSKSSDADSETETASPSRRSVLRSVGAAGAAAAGTTALVGQASAETQDVSAFRTGRNADLNANFAAVEWAFSQGAGRELLEMLAADGHIESADVSNLNVDAVEARKETTVDAVNVMEHAPGDLDAFLVFETLVESDVFGEEIFVRVRPGRDEAGAIIEGDTQYVMSPVHEQGFHRVDNVEATTLTCSRCISTGNSGIAPVVCCQDSCDCDANEYRGTECRDDCTGPNCGSCTLGCDVGCGGGW